MRARIGVGLVGMGIHGMRYARHLLEDLPEARLVAVSRVDVAAGRTWAAARGIRFHADYHDLVADPAVKAVIIVVPPDRTAGAGLAALSAGRPTLVEKPLASTLDEGRSLAAAARRPGACLMVAHTLRWNAVVRAIREQVPSLGRLTLLALSQRFEPSLRPWLDHPGPGGIVLNTGVHSFDLIRHLTGREVESVFCRTATVATMRTEDTFVATLNLEGGLLATVDNCRATGGRSGRIEIAGEAAQLSGDHVLNTLFRLEGREAVPVEVGPPVPTVLHTVRDFLAAARGGVALPVGAEDGLRALRVVEACHLSSQRGRPVQLSELPEDSSGGGAGSTPTRTRSPSTRTGKV